LLAAPLGFAGFADPALPMVGRFRLIARLGMSGMGTVYEAEDGGLEYTVALKMIRGFRFSTADEVSRFQREAQAAARLDHPNIVPVYEIGEIGGCPFLFMKLIRGGTLADRLKMGAMPAEESATIKHHRRPRRPDHHRRTTHVCCSHYQLNCQRFQRHYQRDRHSHRGGCECHRDRERHQRHLRQCQWEHKPDRWSQCHPRRRYRPERSHQDGAWQRMNTWA